MKKQKLTFSELVKLAAKGNAAAQNNIGVAYYNDGQYDQAEIWYSKAVAQGCDMAFFNMGELFEVVKNDYVGALNWYRLASDMEVADAYRKLAIFYDFGLGGLEENEKTAMQYYQNAAERGDYASQCFVAECYKDGTRGLDKNPVLAAQLYQKSAEGGNAEAQFWIGKLFTDGIGVPQNFDKAEMWLGRSAQQGHFDAKPELIELQRRRFGK